ncbi:MAG TPA: LLM class flavin-dependent oxidoreductase [Candidatus Dormibacteraeota bacterium]|nr:LLM class flavin-dependent oxidoreductase [Candidatus Dormibacteraeota bacterium]
MDLRFSVRFNNDVPPAQFARLAALAEESGFDQIWVSNDLFFYSGTVLITAAARATSRIKLGVGVYNPVSMHASEIAMAAISVAELSEGRALLGIGAGADRFLEWARLSFDPPVVRTERAIRDIQWLLAGGSPWEIDGSMKIPITRLPIYVGAMGPRMLRMAGRVADGALPLLFPPTHYRVAAAQIAEGAAMAKRNPQSIDVAACIWCSISNDAERGRRVLAEKLAYYGPSFSPDLLARVGLRPIDFEGFPVPDKGLALGVAGGPEDVASACAQLIADGARHISFGPPLGPDPEEAIRVLASSVIPALKQ